MKTFSLYAAAVASFVVLAFNPVAQAAPNAAAVDAGVQAAISSAVGQRSPELSAVNRDGTVHLRGWAYNSIDLDKAVAAVRRVEGVKRVHAGGVRLWSSRTGSI